MLNIALGGGIQAAQRLQQRGSIMPGRRMSFRVHDEKNKANKKKVKCTYTPELGFDQFILNLQSYCYKYNKRRLYIKGFKGTFKIESWINIETQLRNLEGLKAIGFVDTQLDKEHLDVLSKWLSWINPHKLIIELQQNELDNDDFEDFLYFLFDRNIDVRSIYIIGNPGIYKGVLLKELKQYLLDKYEKNMKYYYELLENKDAYSIAIIRIIRNKTDEKKGARISRAQKKIDQTCYFKLNLRGCFTEANWKGFQDLIQTTYKEDNLEQLCYLDIGNNYLGTQNAFDNMCEQMSSAKGLLVLKIANQPLLVNSSTIQKLMGNRYDCLKLNELDISDNKDILEKTFKLLSDNIFQTCSIINFNGSLPQQLSTLFKLFVFTESFAEKTKENKKLYREQKIFKKNYLQILDLSKVENYNRHDLAEKLLINTVFTEFSNIEKLHVQNFDVGRCQAYYKAKRKFLDYIKQKQNEDPFYKTLKHSLKHIVFPQQSYRMEIETMKEFFLDYLFTETGSFVEIEIFDFEKSTFRQANRAEGLQEACQQVIQKTKDNKEIQYSIKKISMQDGDYQMNYGTYECFFLTSSVKLESFTYIDDSIEFDWDTLYSGTIEFLKSIPNNEFHSLKILQLDRASSINFDAYQFIELFVFHEKIQLQELLIISLTFNINEQSKQSLLDSIEKIYQASLKKFTLGVIDPDADQESLFYEYVIFNQKVNLEYLSLSTNKITQYMDKIYKIYEENKTNNPLIDLKILEIGEIKISTEIQWKQFLQMFLIEQRLTIKKLILNQIIIDQNCNKALNSLLLPFELEVIKQIEEKQLNLGNGDNELSKITQETVIGLPFAIESLKFLSCDLEDDFLTWFSVIGEITQLEIEQCKYLENGINKCLEQIKNRKLSEYFSFRIEQFSCANTRINNLLTFQSIIIKIALNKNRQMLQKLNLENCNLTDEMMENLVTHLQGIKDEQKLYNRVFLLREITLSNNSGISTQKWQSFWDILLNENKFEQKDDQEQQDAINEQQINQSQVYNTLEKDQDNTVLDIVQKIENSQLKLKEKILYNYDLFTPQFPKQIQSLKLNFKMGNLNSDQQKYQYYRLIVGFIIHPESQLQNLHLEQVNLIIFIQACKEAYDFSKQYLEYSLKQSKKTHVSSIESLTIRNMTENDAESTEKLVQMFLCSSHIELKKLDIVGCKFPIISYIMKYINRRQTYLLEELYLQDLDETLSGNDALDYINWIVFGEKMQIKKFSGFPKLSNIQHDQLIQFFPKNKDYEELKLKGDLNDESLKYFTFLVSKLLTSGLKELQIEMTDTTKFVQEILNSITNFKEIQLKKLTLNGQITLNKQTFIKLSQLFDNLEFIDIKHLILSQETEIYDECDLISLQEKKKFRLEITKLQCPSSSNEQCYKKFIFNPNIGFTDVVLKSTDIFQCGMQIYDLKQKIKYLSLKMGLLYNSSSQLSENALSVISKMLIYNESSQLEELILHQCHLKPKGIDALTSEAQNFREKIKKEGRENSCQLTLKRVTLYYSLYIGDDGVTKYSNDLLYFEYVNMERFEVLVTNWNNNMTNSLCLAAKNWIQFQKNNNRKYANIYPIKYLDIGRNEFVDEQQTWQNFLTTFVFTDKTPYLETLNIHFMALDDLKVRYIVNEALLFLNAKPSNYKFTVKKINFSQNNSLTHIGWQNLFQNFFFHPKVHLLELNMISTMLDSQIKLDVIAEVIKKRALASPNKKVPMHTFLCYNVSLKDYIADYLSEQPPGYSEPYDLPLSIEYDDSLNFGYFDGVPEGFGDILQMFQRILKLRKKIVYNKEWSLTKQKFTHYHLSFCHHYLKILNQYYGSQGNQQVEIYLNLQTLNQFASYFRYITEYPGEPYPYCLLFQNDTFNFLRQNECNIYRIKLQQIEFAELQQINQFKVLEIWKNVKDKRTSIDQIQMEYYLDDDLVDEMFKQGYDEADIVSLIRIIPPSKIRIQNSLSIQAIKAIYSIMYDTPYFKYAMISYSFDNFLNIGIGYALREIFYNFKTKSKFGKFTKLFFYNFFNFFVLPTKKYKFNSSVKKLNQYLSTQKLYFFIIFITNFLFLFVTLACPYLFTYKFMDRTEEQMTKQYICINGISKEASYLYYAFAFLTLLVEAILFYNISQIVPDHLDRFVLKKIDLEKKDEQKEIQRFDTNLKDNGNKVVPLEEEKKAQQPAPALTQSYGTQLFQKMKTVVNKNITALTAQGEELTQSKWGIYISCFQALLVSQLFKFDLFNDVVFLMNTYHCEEIIVFYLALATTAFSQGIYIIQLFYFIGVRLIQSNKTAKIMSSKFINDFYAISFLGRNSAIVTILDSTAPFNVIIIPNTTLGRYFFPNHAGKAMSNLVKSYFFQFLCEDLPQTLLQTYFVVSQAIKRSKNIQAQVYLSIVIAILTALSSFHKFLSIRPTNLLQADFDILSTKQAKKYQAISLNNLQEEQKQIQLYIDLHCQPKHDAINVDQQSYDESQTLLS